MPLRPDSPGPPPSGSEIPSRHVSQPHAPSKVGHTYERTVNRQNGMSVLRNQKTKPPKPLPGQPTDTRGPPDTIAWLAFTRPRLKKSPASFRRTRARNYTSRASPKILNKLRGSYPKTQYHQIQILAALHKSRNTDLACESQILCTFLKWVSKYDPTIYSERLKHTSIDPAQRTPTSWALSAL